METIRSESWKEFKNLVDFDNQPSGFRVFKVTIFDGNTGEQVKLGLNYMKDANPAAYTNIRRVLS